MKEVQAVSTEHAIPSLHLAPRTLKASTVTLPGSKSISNRVLLLAALAYGNCEVKDLLHSDDTHYMLAALKALGVPIEQTQPHDYLVTGKSGQFNRSADLFLGNAGTAFRPLTAALAIIGGDFRLSGVARMHERPIGDLVDALRLAGAQIDYLGEAGYPPLRIGERGDAHSPTIPIKGNVSSQFLTALLMALPLTGQAFNIEVDGPLISKPYIAITLNLMARFGVVVNHHDYQSFQIPKHAHYQAPPVMHVEGDASSASYFLAAGLLTGAPITVQGIGKHSIQGDVAFADTLALLGAEVTWGENQITVSRAQDQAIKAFDLDLNHIPDAAMTLAIVALAADGPCRLRNIASWRVKETDRLSAMATELRKLGATVEEGEDYLFITPPATLTPNARIDTYDDHRMAMCFSLVSLLDTPVVINEPDCVAKTFPDYFSVFAQLGQ
ncbi:MAG: 3-phosphoshikimate 1-carboxyvinyltransferase [Neisseriaceae bacterium]